MYKKYAVIDSNLIRTWRKMFEDGYSVLEIARRTNSFHKTIRTYLKQCGYDTSKNKYSCKYYKNKYLLFVYNMQDELKFVFNTPKELCDTLQVHSNVVYNKCDKFRYRKKWYRIYLMEVNEDDIRT